ncbi:MAG TPA: phosphopantetheine-binding protein, partial [Vicinamibacterales bacterium]|nr:phosphopantetheine-binding protein [Vicinamibacterales bacterium]
WRAACDNHGRRIALPTYPFERQRYWISTAQPAPAPDVDFGSMRASVAAALPGDREEVLVEFVREQLASVLRVANPQQIDRRHRLVDLGLDSLMVVELRNRLERGLGWRDVLPTTLVYDYPTIEALLQVLLSRCATATQDDNADQIEARASVAAAPTAAAIEQMSDAEAEALLLEKLGTL